MHGGELHVPEVPRILELDVKIELHPKAHRVFENDSSISER
jgi:hypothetical protein